MVRRAVLVPAALHRSAGLVARDLLHEGVVARARGLRAAGAGVWFDAGDTGEPAALVAARLANFAPDDIELVIPATHARAGEVLADAISVQGLCARRTVVAAVDVVATVDCAVLPRCPDRAWLAACDGRLPWALAPVAPAEGVAGRGSPLPPALHLGDDVWLDLITAWLHRHRPCALAEWLCLLHAHDSTVDPVEAVYAGLHLRDRNSELLVNIL